MGEREDDPVGEEQASGSQLDTKRRTVLQAAGAGAVGTVGLGTAGLGAARSTSTVEASTESSEYGVEYVEADSGKGFNYPYYLFGPPISDDQDRPILVMPNRPPETAPTDDFEAHRLAAQDQIENFGRHFSYELEVPVLVPVFPWYSEQGPGQTACITALDAETMALNETDHERPDAQLIGMVEDAKTRLTENWHPIADGILLDGFDLPGLFANRFAALHPDRVRSVSAGGISGTPILPVEEDGGTELNYPIGVANLTDLVGSGFDSTGFADVDQFVYMGGDATHDWLDNELVWNTEQAATARDVYGTELSDRMTYSESVYTDAGVAARFETYSGVGGGEARGEAIESGDVFAHHRPNRGITSVKVPSPPPEGAASVEVMITVDEDREQEVEVRAFESYDDDLTETVETVAPGEYAELAVQLSEPLEAGDIVRVAVFEPGVDDPNEALMSDSRHVDATYVGFREPPYDGDEQVRVYPTVEQDAPEALELRVGDGSGQELTTEPLLLEPGHHVEETPQLERALSEGEEITVVLQPEGSYDPSTAHAAETETVREELVPEFTYSPESPDVEDEVTFDASGSEPSDTITDYEWELTGDYEIDATGKRVSHSFDEPGEHDVTLVVTGENGEMAHTVETIVVREGCFIATAACGTPDHEQVETLRAFRDATLKGNVLGERLIRCYYATSPPVADWIAQSDRRRSLVRSAIVRPAARLASALGLDGSSTGDATPTE